MSHDDGMMQAIVAGLPSTASQAANYRKKKKRKKGPPNADDPGPKGGSKKAPIEETKGSY